MRSTIEPANSTTWPWLAVGAVAAVAVWFALLLAAVRPWLASLVVAVACGALLWRSRERRARAVWFNVGAVLLIVGVFDAWFGQKEPYVETQTNEGFWRDDADLGTALAPNGRSHHARAYAGTPIFDAVYTTDATGLRSGLPDEASAPNECVLVFGCSFAFGGGLDDAETLPYQLALRLAGQRKVRNFAVGGYGPHHMLALLQNGSVDHQAQCKPVDALYVVLGEHVLRAAGRGDGIRGGPRFELAADGQLVRHGNYPRQAIGGVADKLALGAALTQDPFTSTPDEIALFRAIVHAARSELETRYPGIRFHILVWHARGPLDAALFEGIPPTSLTWVEDVLPKVADPTGIYRFAHDGHPTPLANRLLAEHFAKLLGPSDAAAGDPHAASK